MPVMVSRVLDDLSTSMGSTTLLHTISTDAHADKQPRPTKASISLLDDAVTGDAKVKSFGLATSSISKGRDEDEAKQNDFEDGGIRAQTQATAAAAAHGRTHTEGFAAWQAARQVWTRPSAQGRLPIRKCKAVDRPGELLRGLLGQTVGEFPNAIPLPLAIDLLGDAWEADGLYDP